MRRVFALAGLLSLALCLLPPRAEAWSLVAHTIEAGFTSPITTAGIDTTGADLIVVSVVVDTNAAGTTGANPPTITDSKSNGWTQITAQADGSGNSSATYLFFSHNPTVGSGHTFTCTTATVPAGTITVQAWSGSAVGTVTDQNNAANTAATTSLQPGSITPSQNNSLVVASFGGLNDAGDTQSIGSGFALSDQNTFVGRDHYAGAMAYLVQGSAAAINPTWSWANPSWAAAIIADFVPGAGSPVVVNRRALLGVGQ
jgi:hypothetical protein